MVLKQRIWNEVWITVERSPPPTGFKERGDSLKWFGESRTQDSEQIQRSQWLDTRNQKSSVLYFTPHSFIPSSLMVLAWQLSSLRLLHLVRESKLPALGFYILKSSPIRKEKIKDIRVQGCSLNDPPQTTCAVLDQPSWQGHGVLWLAFHGLVAWPSSTHDCQFPPELHNWSWGEAAPNKVTGRYLGHGRVCNDPQTPPHGHWGNYKG